MRRNILFPRGRRGVGGVPPYTPVTSHYTPEGEGWAHHLMPEVGGFVDQIGGAGTMTATGIHVYNSNGSSPGSSPSYSLTGAMRAESTHAPLLALLDNLDACAVASIWRYTSAASGTDTVWSAGVAGTNARQQLYRHSVSSYPTTLRNGGATVSGTLSEAFVVDDDYYALNIYDGSDTRMLIKGLNLDTNGVEQEVVTANTQNIGAADSFMINASTRSTGVDMGDAEHYGHLIRGDVPTVAQIANTQWWAHEVIGYTHFRVMVGGINAENSRLWNDCPQVNNMGTAPLRSADMLPGTAGFNALLDDIVVRPPGACDLLVSWGETDALVSADASAFQSNLQSIVDEIAVRLGPAGYTFRVFVEPIPTGNTSTYSGTVRTGTDAFVTANANAYSHTDSDAHTLTGGTTFQSADRPTRQTSFDTLIAAS